VIIISTSQIILKGCKGEAKTKKVFGVHWKMLVGGICTETHSLGYSGRKLHFGRSGLISL